MDNKVRYQRTFLIFNQEDSGYGVGQEPSGYVKIEVRDGNGRLTLSVQNLREEPGKVGYKLYLIKCNGNKATPVCAGDLNVKGNKAELEWEFNSKDVNTSGIPIDEFNIAAVIAVSPVNRENELRCPLAAYKGEKVHWKDKVREILSPMKINRATDNDEEELIKKQDVFSKFEDDIFSKYTAMDDLTETANNDRVGTEVNKEDILTRDGMNCLNNPEGISENECTLENSNNIMDDTEYQNTPSNKNNFVNPCLNCQAHDKRNTENNNEADLGKLREYFNSYFESFNPFKSGRKNYTWWKVGNPTGLNNILYSFNIKNPLLFNPRVLMAYYKYRHLTIGIYDDMAGGKKYIVCGIPGVYGIDDRPFGSACKWVQIEGNVPRYGAFGYWLVYLDIKTGKLIT